MRPFGVLALGVVALLLGTAPRPGAHPAPPAAAGGAGDFAGLVDVGGGREMYLTCRGAGSPTVVLEAGYGNGADDWDAAALPPGSGRTAVLPGVAAFARACAYDRPGAALDGERRGRSDPVPMPRGAADVVADLRALLGAAGVPGPYVLVGHSFGGLVVRLYAATYPDDVGGLVLVDAAHEDYYGAAAAVLASAGPAAAAPAPGAPADDPGLERIDLGASTAAVRGAVAASPLRPMPLVVITHGRPWDWPAGYPVAELEGIWGPFQERLAALAPGGRLVVAGRSGHFVPGDQPGLVVAAVRLVVEAVRDPGAWATPAARH